ncbi:hypothetical protein FLL45_22640 [Aliikangiella marina]|uniref:Uncharacterized protein n=1 Tax=Aliikangiella marina TaxID=1712262 RepID=A0A545T1M7_9GAMM|nr:hypothetical protein [Aliikangiella marina]TQV71126.1 hypothetical protein FLL45_22640 [Aliikangiella marina]
MIEIDESVWKQLPENDSGLVEFHDGNGVKLVIHQIGVDAELRERLSDVNKVREYYRANFTEQGMGLVECISTTIDDIPSAKAIGKKIEQGQPGLYVGTIAVPLEDQSFVFSLFSQEIGVTGIRDTAILTKLMSEGKQFETEESTGKMIGWAQDPYFPEHDGPCLRNLSEDEEYDELFPDHPLSKIRLQLLNLEKSIKINLSGRDKKKTWWNFW